MYLSLYFILKLGMELYTAYIDLHQSPELSQYITCQKDNFKAVIKIDYNWNISTFTISIYDLEKYTITDFKHLYLHDYSIDPIYIP